VAVAADPKAQVFDLDNVPVLAAGRWSKIRAGVDGLKVSSKVYAEGGENATHCHLAEHHMFFILAGEATFNLGREGEETFVAGPMSGVLVPKGAFYRFKSSGEENLVMLRVGDPPGDYRGRLDPTGQPLLGDSEANGHVEGVPIPGKFFNTP
jgi:mannose-6-phosphate isomerase-like protein (cupin superfamily)